MEKKRNKIKVMAFGTFDVLHPGHLYYLKQAKKLGDYLIVSVARDINAKKFKGRAPIFSEKERLNLIKNVKFVNKAILGDKTNYLKHIQKETPDIIALGYDQTAYSPQLQKDLKSGKISIKIARLPPYKKNRYKSSLIKNLIATSNKA